MEQPIKHIRLGCSWTMQSSVILKDFKPNSHWLQLIRTNIISNPAIYLKGNYFGPLGTETAWIWALTFPTKTICLALTRTLSKLFPPSWMEMSMVFCNHSHWFNFTPSKLPNAGIKMNTWYFSEYLWVIFFCDCEQLCVVRLFLAHVRVRPFYFSF